MAARGARSRKVVEKQINKEAEKREASKFAPMTARREPSGIMSPMQSWGRISANGKGPADKMSTSSLHSKDSGGSSSKLSSAGSKIIRSIVVAPEQEKFVTPEGGGRMTSAPRGRRGGVPPKLSEAAAAGPGRKSSVSGSRSQRSLESVMGYRPDSRTAGGSSRKTAGWERTKMWYGGLTQPKPFRGFEHDDELWMQDGNCLIFFAEETSDEDPKPMCRIHSQTLEQARSVFMINLLKYGEIIPDEDDADSIAPSSSASAPNPTWPLVDRGYSSMDDYVNDSTAIGALLSPRSPELVGQGVRRFEAPGHSRFGEDDASIGPDGNGHSFNRKTRAGDITHEIWFRAPAHITKPEVQRRHHMATRNYLALLYGRPLVGNDFYEMLSDLQNVMDTYYELNDPAERWNSSQAIMHYIEQRQLDDCRGDMPHALGLMAWCEQRTVQWEAGYLEGFVHASGMFSPKTVEMKEFQNLSPVSKHKLHNCYNALQLRLMDAEERLGRFEFSELWYAEGVTTGHPAQRAFDELREFLRTFYATVFGDWPPQECDHQGHWLSRTVVNRLQADLGALYDYIVDRDVSWDVSEERHTRKWEMVSRGAYGRANFDPDSHGLPVTNMLVGFDTMLKYEHIPHPFPLLPQSGTTAKEKTTKKGFFGKLNNKKEQPLAGPKEQYQMALAFNAATNVDRLGTSFKDNKLLDTFQHHEKSFPPQIINPSDARLGRWMLIYALLQTLSTLSVDVMGLRYSDKIRYFACPSIAGLPPWKSPIGPNNSTYMSGVLLENGATALMHDASQKLSYCWLASSRWGTPSASAGTLTPTPPAYEMSARTTGIGNAASTALPPMMPIPDDIGRLGNAFAAQSLSELDGAAILRRQQSVNRHTLLSNHGMSLAGGAGSSPPPLLRSPVVMHANPMIHPGSTSPAMTTSSIAAMKSRTGELLLSDPSVAKELTGAAPAMSPPPAPAGYSIMPPVTRTPPLANRNTFMSHYYPNTHGHHAIGRPDVPARSPQREKGELYATGVAENGIIVQRDVEVMSEYGNRGLDGIM